MNIVVGLLITLLSLRLLGVVLTDVTSQVGSSSFRTLAALAGG
jgi:hypothetical protein